MPPKSPLKSRPPATKSPTRAPAGKATHKVASSSQIAKAAAVVPSKTKVTSKSPSKKSSTTVVVPPPPPPSQQSSATETSAVCLLQRVGRGYDDRDYVGNMLSRKLREKATQRAGVLLSKFGDHQTKRSRADKTIVSAEKEKAEKQRKLQENLCVFSFDGELAEIKKLIAAGAKVHKKDVNGNVALGEAAVNNQVEVMKYLLEQGADPNARGAYDRTPLWRAAYNSHTDAIKLLLEAGADPRVKAQQESPADKASGDAAKVLAEWDIAKTEKLLARAEEKRKKADEADEQEVRSLTTATESAQQRFDNARKSLHHARCQLELRIVEYDLLCGDATKSKEMREIALSCVKDAETLIEKSEKELEEAQSQYLDARTREQEGLEALSAAGVNVTSALSKVNGRGSEDDIIEIPFGQIADLVLRDSEKKIAKAKKCPLLVDISARASVFLRYRDTNYLDSFQPSNMEPEAIRKALLGGLRYGKPVIIDMRDVPMLDVVKEAIERTKVGLWNAFLDGSFRKQEVWESLIDATKDGDQYAARNFTSSSVEACIVTFLTNAFVLPDELFESFVIFRTEVPEE
eukprot:PhM_4_TR12990/c0_g1_i1/m.67236